MLVHKACFILALDNYWNGFALYCDLFQYNMYFQSTNFRYFNSSKSKQCSSHM